MAAPAQVQPAASQPCADTGTDREAPLLTSLRNLWASSVAYAEEFFGLVNRNSTSEPLNYSPKALSALGFGRAYFRLQPVYMSKYRSHLDP